MLVNKSATDSVIDSFNVAKNKNSCNLLQNITTFQSASMLNVLIVEDDKTTLKIAIKILKTIANNIYEATNGESALEFLKSNSSQIDVIISDLSMPVMNGIELIKNLKQLNINTPIVLLTAEESASVLIDAINLNVHKFLKKPLNIDDIKKILNDIALDKFNRIRHESTQMRFAFLWDMVNSFTMMTITDYNGKITFANDAFCELAGYSEAELIGKTHSLIRHPDTPKSRFAAIWSVLSTGEIWRGILKNRAKNGKDFYVDIMIHPIISTDGLPSGYVGMSHDITARVQSEERAMLEISRSNAILNATPGIVFLTNGRTILHKNENFKKLFGEYIVNIQDLTLENMFLKNVAKEELEIYSYNWVEYVLSYPSVIHLLNVVNADTVLTYYVVTEIVEGDDEFVVIMHDITELEELKNNLEKKVATEIKSRQQKEELLARSSRLALMGEMISMIAHQWRQPLAYITATVGEVQMDLAFGNEITNDNLSRMCTEVSSTAKHLSATIDDFRDFFKPDKKSELVKITNLIKQSVAMVGGTFKNVLIKYNFQSEDITLITYQRELLQVFLNLLKNAADAITEFKPKMPLIIIECFENKDGVNILFKDNGGGIKLDTIDKIFDPYFSTKGNVGTGLGLYMSQTIISNHCGGKLDVFNDDNGAVFRIILPQNKG